MSKSFAGVNAFSKDTNPHGTIMAGIIGAHGNNNTGITGVCRNTYPCLSRAEENERMWISEPPIPTESPQINILSLFSF